MSSASADDTLQHLQALHPEFASLALAFIAYWRQRGVPLTIISGRRGYALNREVGGAPSSLHLQGLAIDVSILWPGFGHIPRAWIPFDWWERLAQPWEASGGRWGGRFPSEDVNHFDAGASLLTA